MENSENFEPLFVGRFCRYDCKGHPFDLLSSACDAFGVKKRKADDCGRFVRCRSCIVKYGIRPGRVV